MLTLEIQEMAILRSSAAQVRNLNSKQLIMHFQTHMGLYRQEAEKGIQKFYYEG